jgi:translation initiation factor 3 subunit M
MIHVKQRVELDSLKRLLKAAAENTQRKSRKYQPGGSHTYEIGPSSPLAPPKMAPINPLVFIDGTFEELSLELAEYLNTDIQPLLEQNQKDEVLKKLITASSVLNGSPEKEFTAAYNLLVYLTLQSPSVNKFLPQICKNLSRPITSSPTNGSGLALSVLTTIFNLLPSDNTARSNVFGVILQLVKSSGLYEILRPQLKKLDTWIVEWDSDESEQRELYNLVAEAAEDAGEEE